jgi:hypothetical protein
VQQEHRLSLWVTQALDRQPTPIMIADLLRHASLLCLPGSREAPLAAALPGDFLQVFIFKIPKSIPKKTQIAIAAIVEFPAFPAKQTNLPQSCPKRPATPPPLCVRHRFIRLCLSSGRLRKSLALPPCDAVNNRQQPWRPRPAPREADRLGSRMRAFLTTRGDAHTKPLFYTYGSRYARAVG